MEQVVYGDVLFFINFCMDFQCLFLTAKLMHRPFALWRSMLAAALGAFYACAALFLSTSGVFAFFADCGVCLMMCVIAFGGEGIGVLRLGAAFLTYFCTSFAVGGVMSGMASLLSHLQLPIGEEGTDLSSPTFFLLALLSGVATLLWGRLTQRRVKGKRMALTVRFLEKSITVPCAVDTANLLRDPVSGRPVALMDMSIAASLFSQELLSAIEKKNGSGLAALPSELACRVRLIPAKTATGEGVLSALAPDAVLLDAGQGMDAIELLIAPVALDGRRGECAVLLPAELIAD